MSDDINALIGRLRSYMRSSKYIITEDIFAAVDTIEALCAERDRLKGEVERITKERDDLDANGIHTCHDNCTKHFCVMRRRMQAAEAERDRLKAALVRLRDCDWVISLPDRMDAVREIAREALEAKE